MPDAFGPIGNLISRKECVNNHKTMMEKFDELKDDNKRIEILITGLPEKIFEKADERYASKTVEKAVYAAIGFMCFAVLGAVMALIFNQ